MDSNNKALKKSMKLLLILLLIGICGIIFSKITNRSICLIYSIVGLPCPSCGMSRAFMSVFRFDFESAFSYHPLFPLVIVLPFLPMIEQKSKKAFNIIITSFILIIIILWVIRLILFFPDIAPMKFNTQALLPKVFQYKS